VTLSSLERRVVDRLRAARASIEHDIEAWVSIPTGWNHALGLDRLRALLRARLQAMRAEIEERPGDPLPAGVGDQGSHNGERIPPTLIARGPRASAAILFSGHLDTVFDPHGAFQVLRHDGDRAIGPGASDMKGGIAIMIAVLEAFRAEGVGLPWTVVLNSDEETGSYHSMSHLRALAPEHGAGIVVEPAMADGALVVERMGSGQLRIDAAGRAAHAGRDFTAGVSAIEALAEAVLDSRAASAPTEGRIVNIGEIEGGEAANIVPAFATARGSVRFRDAAAGRRIDEALRRLERGDEEHLPRVRVRLSLNRPAKPLTAALRPLVDLCLGAAGDLGRPMATASTGGSSDGNVLEDAGLPTLDSMGVCGGHLHRPDEFIELASLGERAALLAVTAMRVHAFLSGR